MSKICLNCGTVNDDLITYCIKCKHRMFKKKETEIKFTLIDKYEQVISNNIKNFHLSHKAEHKKVKDFISGLIKNINNQIVTVINDYFFNRKNLVLYFNKTDTFFYSNKIDVLVDNLMQHLIYKRREANCILFLVFFVLSLIVFSFPIVCYIINIGNTISFKSLFLQIIIPTVNVCFLIYILFFNDFDEKKIKKLQITFEAKGKELILDYYKNIEEKIIKNIKNKHIEDINKFKANMLNELSAINDIPKQISVSLTIFEFDFVQESCRYADKTGAKEQTLNEEIKKYLNLRQAYIQKEIYTKFDKETKRYINGYFELINKYLLEMNIEVGISKRILEEALKEIFKTKDINLSIKKEDDSLGLNIATGLTIGTATILSGFTFTALIASNPLGWLLGATFGLAIVGGYSDGIKNFFKELGLGMNSNSTKKKLENIEQSIKDNATKSLEQACDELKRNLILVNDKIIDNLLSEFEDDITPNLQLED